MCYEEWRVVNAREIEEVADTFFKMCEKYANFEEYYFACYGTLEKLLEQAYNEGRKDGLYNSGSISKDEVKAMWRRLGFL